MEPKFFSQISDHQQSVAPGPYQGPTSYPQLRWWSLIRMFLSMGKIIGLTKNKVGFSPVALNFMAERSNPFTQIPKV